MKDRHADILKHFPTLLRRWQGSQARMCELTLSHRTLRVRLEQSGRTGNLEIACIDPTFIQGPTDWRSSDIAVEPWADGFIVKDEGAGVRIETGHVEIAENRKPFNRFTTGASNEGES